MLLVNFCKILVDLFLQKLGKFWDYVLPGGCLIRKFLASAFGNKCVSKVLDLAVVELLEFMNDLCSIFIV